MVLDRSVSEPDLVWHVPEPSNLWIDAAPRTVAFGEELRLDPRTRDLTAVGRRPVLARARPPHGPTAAYLPVADGDGGAVEEVAAWCEVGAVEQLWHVARGEQRPKGGTVLVDGLMEVIEGAWERLGATCRGAVVLWPLLPGVGDSEEAMSEGLGALSETSPRAVVGLVPELSMHSRRVLSEHYGEALFDALFHPREPRPRRWAAACLELGIEFLPPRVVEVGGRRLERLIAAELALVADLLVGLGASPAEAQRFYRAARWAEATPHDVADLVARGNLAIVPSVDAEIERIIAELAQGRDRSTHLESLIERWTDWERGAAEDPP